MARKKTETKKTGTVYGGRLNVRAEATTNSRIIDTLPDGTVVDILEDVGDWYKIKDGYVMKLWISINS